MVQKIITEKPQVRMTPRLDAANLLWTLYELGRTFERSQALVKGRMVDIRQGNLHHHRKPTKQLMAQRNHARNEGPNPPTRPPPPPSSGQLILRQTATSAIRGDGGQNG